MPNWKYLSFAQLVQIVLKHVRSDKEHYQNYCVNTANICAGIENYFKTRNSTTEICDMLPHILANALNVGINILSPTWNGGGSNLIKVLPRTILSPDEGTIPQILVVRSDQRADKKHPLRVRATYRVTTSAFV